MGKWEFTTADEVKAQSWRITIAEMPIIGLYQPEMFYAYEWLGPMTAVVRWSYAIPGV